MVGTWSGFGDHIKRAAKFDGNNTFSSNPEVKNLRENDGNVGLCLEFAVVFFIHRNFIFRYSYLSY
jgi:hypothetical protein